IMNFNDQHGPLRRRRIDARSADLSANGPAMPSPGRYIGAAPINCAPTGYYRCCLLNVCIHLCGDCIMQQPYTIILAPNPSVMTGPGTNTIVLGGGVHGALVIDPAVDDSAYLDAVVQAGAGRRGLRRLPLHPWHSRYIGGAFAPPGRPGARHFTL